MTNIMNNLPEVKEWDEIQITGFCSSNGNKYYKNLLGVIGTVSTDEEGKWIKVWPTEETSETDNGKLWFNFNQIESLEIIIKAED